MFRWVEYVLKLSNEYYKRKPDGMILSVPYSIQK